MENHLETQPSNEDNASIFACVQPVDNAENTGPASVLKTRPQHSERPIFLLCRCGRGRNAQHVAKPAASAHRLGGLCISVRRFPILCPDVGVAGQHF